MHLQGMKSYREIESILGAHAELEEDQRSRLVAALATLRDEAARAEMLSAALDQFPDEIFLKDRDGRYLLANRECEFALALPPGGLDGKFDLELYGPEFAERFRAEDAEIFATGKPIYCEPVSYTHLTLPTNSRV